MVRILRKPLILKSYFIVSSIITGNAHKTISHYVIDLDNITGRGNIIKGCNITTVGKITPMHYYIA